jgi:cyclophilin family peptidyl-prolyl cis-trans isomerase
MKTGRVRRWIVVAVPAALAIAVLVVILVGRGGNSTTATTTDTVPGCKAVSAPEPKQISLSAPKQTVRQGEALTAEVKTSCGSFEIALDSKHSPKTVNSFVYLARNGFYEGLDFYKAISGFAIYGGDPQGDGSGGPGYSVVEPPPADTKYSKRVVAMAREPSQPLGYSGSRFFIATSLETGLPPDFALLGEVTGSYETVARIDELATPEQKTAQPVLIEEITVRKG